MDTDEGGLRGELRLVLPLFLFAAALAMQFGCRPNSSHPEQILIVGRLYEITSVERSVPVDLNNVDLVGCADREKAALALCLGRVSPPILDIRRITVAWAERPMAARVEIGDYCYLYLSRQTNGTWEVKEAIAYDPEDVKGSSPEL